MSDTSPTLPARASPWMMQASLVYPQRVRIHRVYSEIELRIASAIADGMSTPAGSGAQPGKQ
jgi:hypothetical protein